jgi:hypothetical protein
MERVQAHLAGLVEVVDAEVGDDDAGAAPEPALLTPDPLALLRAAEIAGARPEVDPLDKAARALAHDHEHLACIDRDLAGTTASRQARRRVVVVADHGRVDVPEPVDLGRAEEANVDQPALEVEREQLEHARRRGRPGDDRRVADAQRETRRPGAEHAGLVDELEVRGDRPLGEVHRDVRQADADEADPLTGERPSGRHDHHLGLREGVAVGGHQR